jgi:hypothetical protein
MRNLPETDIDDVLYVTFCLFEQQPLGAHLKQLPPDATRDDRSIADRRCIGFGLRLRIITLSIER